MIDQNHRGDILLKLAQTSHDGRVWRFTRDWLRMFVLDATAGPSMAAATSARLTCHLAEASVVRSIWLIISTVVMGVPFVCQYYRCRSGLGAQGATVSEAWSDVSGGLQDSDLLSHASISISISFTYKPGVPYPLRTLAYWANVGNPYG